MDTILRDTPDCIGGYAGSHYCSEICKYTALCTLVIMGDWIRKYIEGESIDKV